MSPSTVVPPSCGEVLDLGDVALRDGSRLALRRLSPPAPEYAERLGVLLDHKPPPVLRKIRRQLSGAYCEECVDRFFIGEIDGRLAGHLWYGYGRDGAGTANFGEVFTAPEFRRRGVADALTAAFAADADASPIRLALCTAGEVATRIYARHGFRTVIPGATHGPLVRFGPRESCADFREYAADYYTPGKPVTIQPGSIRHRHDIDCLLRFTHILRGGDTAACLRRVGLTGASLAGRIGPAWHVANAMEACFQAEDGRGVLSVATLPGGRVVGWAFALRRESPAESGNAVLDVELHPAYAAAAEALIAETLRRAAVPGLEAVHAWCSAAQRERLEALTGQGFESVARLPDYCQDEHGARHDAVILCWHPRRRPPSSQGGR